MFIQLHGLINNERLLISTDQIEAIQELKKGSKYYETYSKSGAKSILRVNGQILPVKETIVQITHVMKRTGLVGGAS